MKKLCFATGNAHKLKEIKDLLNGRYDIISLKDLEFDEDIEETGDTLKANAKIKAGTIAERFAVDVFADDTGLEVDALGGAPGVYSARYAGESCSYQDNVDKLLKELDGQTNRKARFKTCICLMMNGEEYFFEGTVEGEITESESGNEGFGYDPVFLPDGFQKTFAQMEAAEKNAISHRGRAIQKLVDFLQTL